MRASRISPSASSTSGRRRSTPNCTAAARVRRRVLRAASVGRLVGRGAGRLEPGQSIGLAASSVGAALRRRARARVPSPLPFFAAARGRRSRRRPAPRGSALRSSWSSQPRGSTSAAAWRLQRSPCVRAACSSSSTSQAWRCVDWKRSVTDAGAPQPARAQRRWYCDPFRSDHFGPELMTGRSSPACARPARTCVPSRSRLPGSTVICLTSCRRSGGSTVAGAASHYTGSNGTGTTKSPREERTVRVEETTELVLELDAGRTGGELAAPRLRGRGGSRRRALERGGLASRCGGRRTARSAILELPAPRRRQRPRVTRAELARARVAFERRVEPDGARRGVEGERRDGDRAATEASALSSSCSRSRDARS